MTKGRKIGKGASDHTDERIAFSPLKSLQRSPLLTAERPPTRAATHGNSSASVQPAPTGSSVTCRPAFLWELTHPSHIRMKCFLAQLPTPERTGQRKQTGGGGGGGK